MKKIVSSVLALCATLSCVSLAACGKKAQDNTLEFTGVYQSATGEVYLQIDNIADYDPDVYLEYTVDGGNTWQQAMNFSYDSKRTVKPLNFPEDSINKTVSFGVRLGENDGYAASAPSKFIEYKVKSVSEVREIFVPRGDDRTDGYSNGKVIGITAFKLCEKSDKSFAVEKFDHTESPENDAVYDYTFALDNWDKSAIEFEYKFVEFDRAFEKEGGYITATELKDYTDVFATDGWIDYDPTSGITEAVYRSHLEDNTLDSVGWTHKVFTVLIRAKATDNNLCSPCSPVYVIAETAETE